MKNILVVDDHSIVRHGLSALLNVEADLTVCAEAADYDEALLAVAQHQPDVMIVDITLKDKSGLDLIRALRLAGCTIPILVLSMHDEEIYAARALRAGAQGYVMKEHADEVIVDAVRTISRGETYLSEAASQRMLKQMIGGSPETARPATGIESLTQREQEIFTGIGQGRSTREMAEQLGLSTRTVEVHRAHIKKKLGCENAAQVVREAVKWVENVDSL